MGKDPNELASYVRPLWEQFSALAQARGIPILLVDTGRTPSEQEVKLEQGVSWTQHSRHLPQPPELLSEAFDVVPKAYLAVKGWSPGGDLWSELGEIGEGLGLEWGGRFPGRARDPGHFQWKRV